jgi:hypothetical protein
VRLETGNHGKQASALDWLGWTGSIYFLTKLTTIFSSEITLQAGRGLWFLCMLSYWIFLAGEEQAKISLNYYYYLPLCTTFNTEGRLWLEDQTKPNQHCQANAILITYSSIHEDSISLALESLFGLACGGGGGFVPFFQ